VFIWSISGHGLWVGLNIAIALFNFGVFLKYDIANEISIQVVKSDE
jgi:hypothetical protein